jgi:hypothetical protein
MKVKWTLVAVGLLGILQLAVQGQSTNANVSASGSKAELKPGYPQMEYKLDSQRSGTEATPAEKTASATLAQKGEIQKPGTKPAPSDKIERYGDTSSQPWPATVTRRYNPTVFHDARTHEPQLIALSLSF